MTPVANKTPLAQKAGDIFVLLVRWTLGTLFIYMGLHKALHPVEFLKLVRQYELTDAPLLLNLVAAGLPWFEIYCGLLLVLGVAVRGAALLLVTMLVPFTLVVFRRALAIHGAGDIAFCAIKFDCGCGNGEVFICRKILENLLMVGGSFIVIFHPRHWFCLRHNLFGRR